LAGVVSVAAGVDKAEFGVDALDEGVGDPESDGGQNCFDALVQAVAKFD
jgi:hypothetical protein